MESVKEEEEADDDEAAEEITEEEAEDEDGDGDAPPRRGGLLAEDPREVGPPVDERDARLLEHGPPGTVLARRGVRALCDVDADGDREVARRCAQGGEEGREPVDVR